jgi:potassium-transporting ATPase potassium-binding subunit
VVTVSLASIVQLLVLIGLIGVTTPVLGAYLAKVYGAPVPAGRDTGWAAPGDAVFGPVERLIYRAGRVDERREQRWNTYALSLLAFSLVSVLVVYALQRLQGALPLNPDGMAAVPAPLSFNTAVSFVTNTNWQNYSGESTMSILTQMAGLAVQNFVSAAVGIACAVALIRALTRGRALTIGNFWVDVTRTIVRVLLPLSFVVAIVFASQGMVQNLSGARQVTTVEGNSQSIPGGMAASQESIKEIGTNGGGYYNANSAHPFENPNAFTNLLQNWTLLSIPFALTYAFGSLAAARAGSAKAGRRQGWAVFAAMFVLWLLPAVIAMGMEVRGNVNLDKAGATQAVTAEQGGGNAEGKEVRFGPATSGLFAASTTGTSTGAVINAHDSMTPLGGMMALFEIQLGEVSPGGTGSGLYGMLIFALLSVFIAGLMVGRTPEYLGRKVQATEMKLVVLYILFVPLVVLGFSGASMVMDGALSSLANSGPHGLTEMVYAFTSAGNNNGSAFGGLTGNTDWFNTTLGLCMLVGRFLLMIPMLAIAGSLARKQPVPPSAGTFPTGTPLFAALLTGVVVIVVGLTYFPVLALGPLVEHLTGSF